MRLGIAIALAAGLLVARIAAAQPSDADKKAAEEYFTKANTAYNLGHFEEAVDWFTKAYQAWPQAEFLYNIAQSYRLAGNCKQALFVYKRFLSLKEHDTASPLPPKKQAEIEKFISDLTECANKTESSAAGKPDTVDRPPNGPAGAPTAVPGTTPTPATPTTPAKAGPTTASSEEGDKDEDEGVTKQATTAEPTIVTARLIGGGEYIKAGDLSVPIQPVFGVQAGHPFPLRPITLLLGGELTYTPLPYQVNNEQRRGTMLGAHVTFGASYPVMPQVAARAELAVGVSSLSGLVEGNPLTTTRMAGSFTLPSARLGLAADYAVTPNVIATVAPISFGFSPGASGMYPGSLIDLQFAVGVGYRR